MAGGGVPADGAADGAEPVGHVDVAVAAPGHRRVVSRAVVGDAPDVTRVAEREEETPVEGLGWKLKMTHFIAPGSFHGLLRLEDGRLCPITRDGGEDVFKSSWVTFSR